MTFPDATVIVLGRSWSWELWTDTRYLQLNVPALDAKPIFLSNGKVLLLLLALLFIFVSKLSLVWFQMGPVWKEFYSSLLLLEKYHLPSFRRSPEFEELWHFQSSFRSCLELKKSLLLKEINVLCVITECQYKRNTFSKQFCLKCWRTELLAWQMHLRF